MLPLGFLPSRAGARAGKELHMTSPQPTAMNLSDLVKEYKVCWEVWPEYLMVGKEQRQVGFELELTGAHASGSDHPGPNCPTCRRVFRALYAIAEWTLPKEQRPSMYEIEPYEQTLRFSPVRGNRPDVTLKIKVLHRSGFQQPVDACEVRCLNEMRGRLRQLGACERQWSNR